MNPFYPSLKVIWDNPKFVFVNEEQLKKVSKEIAKEDLKIPNWRAPVFYPEDDENLIQLFGIENSINFAFTDFKTKKKFKIEFKGQEWTGSFAMAGSLMRAIEEGIPILAARYLKDIDLNSMKHIFREIPGYPMPMLEARTEIFREIGMILLKKYKGSFWNLFRSAGFKAFGRHENGIVHQLRQDFPSFNDISGYRNGYLHFHKRSQLLVMIYQGRALDSNGKLPLIKDIDDLGAIADYEVPKVLEYLGILEYAPSLKQKILNQEIIEKNSREEQKIRAMTVLAMKNLLEKINQLRRKSRREKINMCHLDYRIWKMGKDASNLPPHHLTPTIFY